MFVFQIEKGKPVPTDLMTKPKEVSDFVLFPRTLGN